MDFEVKIEFQQIRKLLKEHCLSSMGESYLDNIHFSSKWENIVKLQEENEEFRQILLFEPNFPLKQLSDIRSDLKHLQIEGSHIKIEHLCELKNALETIRSVLVFFRVEREKESNRFPRLQDISNDIVVNNELIHSISRIIDNKGRIRDNASGELQQIRRQIFQTEQDIEKKLKKIVREAKQEHLLESNTEITIRDGRLCLPVPAANKRKLKGFIHDESASGQTVFIEPQEIFDLNNNLRDLQLAEKREILKILTIISNEIRPLIPEILKVYEYSAYLDFVRAKAKFALDINGVKPVMLNKAVINWKKAKHPLLYITLKRQNREIVPIDIELNENRRILIISGPNAGGKSVCLKTIGILQYMFQCGLPVSTSELSEFGCFKNIHIDIGDEQSIENDLSTYSSHLKNMDYIIRHSNSSTLFLVDELGGGTDPQYGGAIAEATLEYLSQKKTMGVVSTHFGNLKNMAENIEGIENGAMLFDKNELKPLFKLQIGKAGSSFTFDIAEKIGFSHEIIVTAKNKIGHAQINYEALLQKVELEKINLENERKMCEAMDNELSELIAKQDKINQELQTKKHDIVKRAKQEAESLMENANKIIEKTVREIKESKADKTQLKKIREKVKTFHEEVKKIQLPAVPEKTSASSRHTEFSEPIKIGDYVIINETQTIGQIVEIKDDDVMVSFNSINFRTTLDKVSRTKLIPPSPSKRPNYENNYIYSEINKKAALFKLELDVRGMHVQEVEDALQNYLDDALILQIHEIRIIHGKGNGILREAVRSFLSKDKNISEFRDESMENGGYGVTVVKIR